VRETNLGIFEKYWRFFSEMPQNTTKKMQKVYLKTHEVSFIVIDFRPNFDVFSHVIKRTPKKTTVFELLKKKVSKNDRKSKFIKLAYYDF